MIESVYLEGPATAIMGVAGSEFEAWQWVAMKELTGFLVAMLV